MLCACAHEKTRKRMRLQYFLFSKFILVEVVKITVSLFLAPRVNGVSYICNIVALISSFVYLQFRSFIVQIWMSEREFSYAVFLTEICDLVSGFPSLWKMEIDNELAFTVPDRMLGNGDDLPFMALLLA